MKGVLALAWLSAVFGLALADGLSKYASPDIEFSRVFRPDQDMKMVESRQTNPKHRLTVPHAPLQTARKPASRPTGSVVYGKPTYLEQQPHQHTRPSLTRNTHKKFKPSPEDPFFVAENYAPSQKYLQKYANQLYNAQKNAGQLSEYQKYILGQDPALKNYVFGQTRKPKNVEISTVATTVKRTTTTTTEKPTTTEKVKVAAKARRKEKKKEEEEVEDSAAQSTGYKFVFKPEYVPVYTTHEKDVFSVYGQPAHFTPGYTQYVLADELPSAHAVPTTYAVHHQEHKEDHHEYPTKEPKYEFKYEVKDHEKNSNFGHAEARKGKTTWGKYYVQLSDGRFETVKYWADKTGYHAEVDFKGHAQHPKPKEQPIVAHGFAADDLKHYAHVSPTPHQFYAVSEHAPAEY